MAHGCTVACSTLAGIALLAALAWLLMKRCGAGCAKGACMIQSGASTQADTGLANHGVSQAPVAGALDVYPSPDAEHDKVQDAILDKLHKHRPPAAPFFPVALPRKSHPDHFAYMKVIGAVPRPSKLPANFNNGFGTVTIEQARHSMGLPNDIMDSDYLRHTIKMHQKIAAQPIEAPPTEVAPPGSAPAGIH